MKLVLSLLVVVVLMDSCYVNSNLMLKTDKNFVFDTIPSTPPSEYRISPNDIISFKIFTNDGFEVISIAAGVNDQGGANRTMFRNTLNYFIQSDGTTRLPELGVVNLKGYTVREAEFYLETRYAEKYVKPFVQLQVINKRVIVFPGNGSDAQVITLENNNTTLMEAIAMAGGIPVRGKAANIKIIRKSDIPGGQRKVYEVDLSTIDGLKHCDMIVQANDYIYVEPVPQLGNEILRDITPIISLLTSAVLVYSIIQRF
ncbi:MAG: polysaccharide biosynthesis/export family protein [Bacteroidota bacterium]